MLEYWREYRTYFQIGLTYGISKSAAYRNIKWCENSLARSKAFRLPGRMSVAESERVIDIVLIDSTETPIERPKKLRRYYSGRKKRHTLRTQLVVEKSTRRVLRLAREKGRRHDNRPFKASAFICILRRKPLSIAAIEVCRNGTPRRTYPKSAAKRFRCPQATRKETAPFPANACHARTSSPC